MNSIALVSVCMITYNHESYIEEAILGVLMQECDFGVELIISNDNSPDNTDTIIQNIIKNHPKGSWIKYFKQEKNLGMMPNAVFALNECKAKYIALCEGDDFWIDPLKLQKQVDFLEENENYSLSCTNVKIYYSEANNNDRYKEKPFDFLTLYDVLQFGFSHTSTHLYRREIINLEVFQQNLPTGDRSTLIMASQIGTISYLHETTSVYRIHEKSNWSSLQNEQKYFHEINLLNYYLDYFVNDKKAVSSIHRGLMFSNYHQIFAYLRSKKYYSAYKTYFNCIVNFCLSRKFYGTSSYVKNRISTLDFLKIPYSILFFLIKNFKVK
jgi:glycosyltransferase involved in cell wall biosynthesis